MTRDSVYFGSYRKDGHHPYGEGMILLRYNWDAEFPVAGVPWTRDVIDGGLCPGHSASPQGRAALHHKNGWTALAFWDRSDDTRPGSHSTFFIEGTHDFETMKRLCQERFPEVWKRYTFEVVRVP